MRFFVNFNLYLNLKKRSLFFNILGFLLAKKTIRQTLRTNAIAFFNSHAAKTRPLLVPSLIFAMEKDLDFILGLSFLK